jgi:hypothetical protein
MVLVFFTLDCGFSLQSITYSVISRQCARPDPGSCQNPLVKTKETGGVEDEETIPGQFRKKTLSKPQAQALRTEAQCPYILALHCLFRT